MDVSSVPQPTTDLEKILPGTIHDAIPWATVGVQQLLVWSTHRINVRWIWIWIWRNSPHQQKWKSYSSTATARLLCGNMHVCRFPTSLFQKQVQRGEKVKRAAKSGCIATLVGGTVGRSATKKYFWQKKTGLLNYCKPFPGTHHCSFLHHCFGVDLIVVVHRVAPSFFCAGATVRGLFLFCFTSSCRPLVGRVARHLTPNWTWKSVFLAQRNKRSHGGACREMKKANNAKLETAKEIG